MYVYIYIEKPIIIHMHIHICIYIYIVNWTKTIQHRPKSSPSHKVVVDTHDLWWRFRHGHTHQKSARPPARSVHASWFGWGHCPRPATSHRANAPFFPRGFHGGPTMGCGVPRDRTIHLLHCWKKWIMKIIWYVSRILGFCGIPYNWNSIDDSRI